MDIFVASRVARLPSFILSTYILFIVRKIKNTFYILIIFFFSLSVAF